MISIYYFWGTSDDIWATCDNLTDTARDVTAGELYRLRKAMAAARKGTALSRLQDVGSDILSALRGKSSSTSSGDPHRRLDGHNLDGSGYESTHVNATISSVSYSRTGGSADNDIYASGSRASSIYDEYDEMRRRLRHKPPPSSESTDSSGVETEDRAAARQRKAAHTTPAEGKADLRLGSVDHKQVAAIKGKQKCGSPTSSCPPRAQLPYLSLLNHVARIFLLLSCCRDSLSLSSASLQ